MYYTVRIIFISIFTLNIIGAIHFYNISGSSQTLDAIVVGFISFFIGIFLGRWNVFKKKKSIFFSPTIIEIKQKKTLQSNSLFCICILFSISFFLSCLLFFFKGIPLFSANDNELRSSFGIGTYGLIRALGTWCPMACIFVFFISIINKKYKIVSLTVIGLTILLLAFYSFKGNIVWLAMMIFLTNTIAKKKIEFVKGIFLFLSTGIVILSIFSVWLSVDSSTALFYLIKRITQDQVDGLNYIIQKFIPLVGFYNGHHFSDEFTNTFFSIYKDSFDIKLASYFYGKSVSWGIVQTLYGFLYIDYGFWGIIVGFLILGVLVRKIENAFRNINELTIQSLCFYIYLVYILLKMFLVGNIFNEIKGPMFSALFFNVFYIFIYSFLYKAGKLKIIKRLYNVHGKSIRR